MPAPMSTPAPCLAAADIQERQRRQRRWQATGVLQPLRQVLGGRRPRAEFHQRVVAIPHGRIKGLKEALGAFIRLAQPVPFDAPDGNPVTLVFVLLVPEKATEKHLQILSELAQMFSEKALREAMSRAADAAALHQLIAAWQPDAAGQRRAAA